MLRNSILSYNFLLFSIILICTNFYSKAQNVEIDTTTFIKDTIVQNDTLGSNEFVNDSIMYELIQDTLRSILNQMDTIQSQKFNINLKQESDSIYLKDSALFVKDSLDVDTIQHIDSVPFLNKIIGRDSISLSDSILLSDSIPLSDLFTEYYSLFHIFNMFKDSLYFDEPDSVSQVISSLRTLIYNDKELLNDSTKNAIYKLIDYTRSRDIKPVINYLEASLKKSELLFDKKDSTLNILNDSIYNAVQFLINTIPEDSTKFYVTNLNSDSASFKSAAHEKDSIRVNLVDNRGESAVLWIKKSGRNVFEIYLEDGTYIEKARQQRVVNNGIESTKFMPRLKRVDKVRMIIPIWTFGGLADIRFNQGYISKSWAEGGESSVSALSVFKYSADYTYGKLRNFDSDVEYQLGYLKAGDDAFQKNDDKFELNVKYGTTAFNNWYYSGLLNFKTQFLKGYEYTDSSRKAISEILSPAHLVFSFGLDYKPSNKFTILFSPLTSKFTIVADTVNYDQTRFGVGKDEIIRKELGAYVKAISKIKFKNNLTLENKVNFFTNYVDNPQNIDVDWEVNLVVRLSDYIKMSINAHFIHDDDVKFIDEKGKERGARSQFKELFGIGFSYTF